MLLVVRWLNTLRARIKSVWNFLSTKLFDWFSSIPRYQREVDDMLKPQAEVEALYQLLLNGSPEEHRQAFEKLKRFADSPDKKPINTYSRQLLNFIYSKGLTNQKLQIWPDKSLAKQYALKSNHEMTLIRKRLDEIKVKLGSLWFFKEGANILSQKIASKKLEWQLFRAESNTTYHQMAKEQASSKPSKASCQKRLPPPRILDKLHFALDCIKRDDIDTAEKYFGEIKPTKSFPLTEEETLIYEQLCIKLAKYYEGCCLQHPSSWNVDSSGQIKLDFIARMNLEKALGYFKLIRHRNKKYEQIQFKLAHYYGDFLGNAGGEKISFKRSSRCGNRYSAYRFIIIDFQEFWQNYKVKLNAEEKGIVDTYEVGNQSFFKKIKLLPLSLDQTIPQEKAISLVKKLITELTEYNKRRVEHCLSPIDGITELNRQLQETEAWMVKAAKLPDYYATQWRPILRMSAKLQHRFDTEWRQDFQETADLYQDLRDVDKTLLISMLHFIEILNSNCDDASVYYKILQNAYFQYLSQKCSKLLYVDTEEQEYREYYHSKIR